MQGFKNRSISNKWAALPLCSRSKFDSPGMVAREVSKDCVENRVKDNGQFESNVKALSDESYALASCLFYTCLMPDGYK